jgi:hypothetical protein
MDKFRTPVTIPGSALKIGYNTPCMLIGSCFSDYIGKLMLQHKWPVLLNPFGTLFNPLSIADALEKLASAQFTSMDDLRFHNGLWFSFSHYTGFSHPDREICLNTINRSETEASEWLKKCRVLIITFGSAWCYQIKETGLIAANCHKIPSSAFNHILAQPDMIIKRYEGLIGMLQNRFPNLHIIFTVSPVRHWKDGAVNNQLSKSVLHWSIHEIMKVCAHTEYFPSYELFMDELRDYRFYATDMLHPSEQGTQYVWERFCDTYTVKETCKIMDEVAALLKAVHHRTQFNNSAETLSFRQATIQKLEALAKTHPFLDFSSEIAMLM